MKIMVRTSIAILLFLASCALMHAQDLSKYYIKRMQEPNDLYFIFPFKDYQEVEGKSPFYFDITYLGGNDSVVLNYTYYSEEPMPSDTLIFIAEDHIFPFPSTRIYEDYLKKEWENRFQVKMPYIEWTKIIRSSGPPRIEVISSGRKRAYSVKEKKWEPYSGAMDKILYIIQTRN